MTVLSNFCNLILYCNNCKKKENMRILIYLDAAVNEQYTFHRIREYKHGGIN